MNLVISGPIDDELRIDVIELSRPNEVIRLSPTSERMDHVDDSREARAQVIAACHSKRVDHAYTEEGIGLASFKLLAIDMDSTLITIECIDEIASYVGKREQVAAITEATMRGELTDYAESLRRRAALLKDSDESILEKVFIDRLQISPGGTELMQSAAAAGIYTLLLSGGFSFFSNKLKETFSIDEAYANELQVKDARLTGIVLDPIVDAAAKANFVRNTMKRIGCSADQALVIGDGANDIPMMETVNHSLAYHAKPLTARAAKYAVQFGSLATVLDFFPPGC